MQYGALVVAMTVLSAASLPAAAQGKLDMNKVTCRDYLGYNTDTQDFVRYWMSGYYSAAANNNVLDYNRLLRNSAKVTSYCGKHKSDTLPTAIKNALGS